MSNRNPSPTCSRGDTGTSPLYTRTFGVTSLRLVIIVAMTYVSVALRADKGGERRFLALTALLGIKRQQRPAIQRPAFDAALIYGESPIT